MRTQFIPLRTGGDGPARSRTARVRRTSPAGGRRTCSSQGRSYPQIRAAGPVPCCACVRVCLMTSDVRRTREVDVHGGRRAAATGHRQIAQGSTQTAVKVMLPLMVPMMGGLGG
jgi:hypothetical protein